MAITAKFDADFSQFSSEVGKAESQLNAFVADVGKLVTGFVSAEAIMAGVSAAWQTFTGFLEDSIKAAEGAEVAHAQMVAALEAHAGGQLIAEHPFRGVAANTSATRISSSDWPTRNAL